MIHTWPKSSNIVLISPYSAPWPCVGLEVTGTTSNKGTYSPANGVGCFHLRLWSKYFTCWCQKICVNGCKFNQLRATGSIDAGFWDSAALWINLWRLRIANHTHLWSDREAGWIPSNPLTYFASHCGSGIFALLDMELILEGPLFHYGGKSKKEVALSHSHSIPLRFWTVELIALEPVTIPIESSQIEQKRLTSSAAKKIWGGLLCPSLCKPRVPGLGTSAAALPCELKSDFDRVKDLFLQTWEATSETYQHHVSPSWSLYQRLLLASRNSSNSLPIITTYR